LDNVIQLYQAASLHQATQLEQVCAQFITRNFSKLRVMEVYLNLPDETKNEVQSLVKHASTDSSGMRVGATTTTNDVMHDDVAEGGVNQGVEAAV